MPRFSDTRLLARIAKEMSKSFRKKKSDEAGDDAYDSQLQDEKIARQLHFEELNLQENSFIRRTHPSREFDRGFDSSPLYQASSSASASNNSRAPYQAPCVESVACTEAEANFLRAFGFDLTPRILKKECGICIETLPQSTFISTTGCAHEYCSDCCKHHAEAKIMSGGSQIKCPHENCSHSYNTDQCQQLLSASDFDILNTRLTEAAIPAALKVYCPYGDCSAFMEKPERSSVVDTFAECYSCHRGFCQECNVRWHADQTCAEYCANELNTRLSGDQKLRDLAKQEKWQQCADCHRMIELRRGCHHMTCLCGNEFCYVCGAKWKNKVATCKCDLFDEARIIHD